MFYKFKKKNAVMFGLSEEEYSDFLNRYFFYLKGKNLTRKTIDNGFFIVDRIIENRVRKQKENLNYATKNPLILKYREEIVELYAGGMGEKAIEKAMKINHKVTISYHKIRYFLNKNKLLRTQKFYSNV